MGAGDRAYEVSLTLEILDQGEGGLLLFYSQRMYVGIGFSTTQMRSFNYGEEQVWMRADMATSRVQIRLRNEHHDVTLHYRQEGQDWVQHPWQMEVSGMHHNVLGGFLSLRPGVYSCGRGSVRLRDFRYRALP